MMPLYYNHCKPSHAHALIKGVRPPSIETDLDVLRCRDDEKKRRWLDERGFFSKREDS